MEEGKGMGEKEMREKGMESGHRRQVSKNSCDGVKIVVVDIQ